MTIKNDMEQRLSWERELSSALSHLPLSLFCYETTDSTNTQAKNYVLEGGRGAAAFVANEQTAGRGRMGRSFFSPGDTGIYLSLLCPVAGVLRDAVAWTTGASVAVARAISAETGIEVGIKWVNDLYYRERKVCGILAESFLWEDQRYVILGVGINLSTTDFPEELSLRAGSLMTESGDRKLPLTAALVKTLYAMMTEGAPSDWMEEYRRRSTVLGYPITYRIDGREYRGQAVAIEDDGALLVLDEDGGKQRLSSGEITLRLRETKGGIAHE